MDLLAGGAVVMIISSRTPEGDPNRCAVCGQDTRTEPSTFPTRDAPCPHCGSLLWFGESVGTGFNSRVTATSYEALVMSSVRQRLGPLPIELQRPLLAAIASFVQQGRLSDRIEIVSVLAKALNWHEVVQQLELQANKHEVSLQLESQPKPEGSKTWAFSAGAYMRKQLKRLFAKSQS